MAQIGTQEPLHHGQHGPRFSAAKKPTPEQQDECSANCKSNCRHQGNCCHYLLIIDHQALAVPAPLHTARPSPFKDNLLILKEFPREPFRPPCLDA